MKCLLTTTCILAPLGLLAACYSDADYRLTPNGNLSPESIVILTCAPETAPVGKKVDCEAVIASDVPENKRGIVFQTSLGNFTEKDSPTTFERAADRGGLAKITLTSSSAGVAKVTARAKSADVTSTPVSVAFQASPVGDPAGIEALTVDGFAAQGSALDERNLSAKVVDASDRPVPDVEVTVAFFRDARLSQPHPEGRFRNLSSSDSGGKVSAIITAGETAYRGSLWVEVCINEPATAPGGASAVLWPGCAALELLVVDPITP